MGGSDAAIALGIAPALRQRLDVVYVFAFQRRLAMLCDSLPTCGIAHRPQFFLLWLGVELLVLPFVVTFTCCHVGVLLKKHDQNTRENHKPVFWSPTIPRSFTPVARVAHRKDGTGNNRPKPESFEKPCRPSCKLVPAGAFLRVPDMRKIPTRRMCCILLGSHDAVKPSCR